MTIRIDDMPVMRGPGAPPTPHTDTPAAGRTGAERYVRPDVLAGLSTPPTSRRRRRSRIATAAAVAGSAFMFWTALRDRADQQPIPRGPITTQQWLTIARGENAIQAALAYKQADLATIGQPRPDYGPNCTPNGCIANIP
jgi:hypothetical protein